MQGYPKAQNKKMEADLSSKWTAKKKAGVAILSLMKYTLKQQRSKETEKDIT